MIGPAGFMQAPREVPKPHTELLKAHIYYGRRSATGWVLLVNGKPWHFTGRTGKRDAEAAQNEILSRSLA